MSEWMPTTVGAIADVYDGPHATPEKTPSGPWFLSISSLIDGRLDLQESAHLSEADFKHWTRRVTPQENDVLFSYETRLGEAALMPPGIRACLGRRMALLRARRAVVEPRFLLYAYLAPSFQGTIRERTIHGATVDRIPLVDLPTWPISIPSLPEQRAIASLLGAFDDKIAANDRLCAAHEELLRARFEKLLIDTTPDARNMIRTRDLVEFNPVLGIPTSDDVVYLDMAAVPTSNATVREWAKRPPRSGTRFTNGDTVMARITPCLENGKTAFIDFMEDNEIGIGSTEFIVMRARPGVPEHLPYFLARSLRFRTHAVVNMSGSSGRQRVGADQLADFPLTAPDLSMLSIFGLQAAAAFAHIRSLTCETLSLVKLRDALLPELMSGETRVRNAEKIVQDAT